MSFKVPKIPEAMVASDLNSHKPLPMLNPEALPGLYLAQLAQTAHQEGLTGFMVVLFYPGAEGEGEIEEGTKEVDKGGSRIVETEISGVRVADAYFGLRVLGNRLDRGAFGGEEPDDEGEVG